MMDVVSGVILFVSECLLRSLTLGPVTYLLSRTYYDYSDVGSDVILLFPSD